ncbi:hypothetical protein BJ165DRAFT_1358430, partial [Panaeolus papilionaceus]
MLYAKDLCLIDRQLSKLFDNAKPFGGLNMIFSGDFAQLPPPFGGENGSLYSRHIGAIASNPKAQDEAIGKAIWHQVTTVIILRQNMRQRSQSEQDTKLRKALENMRYKACTSEDVTFLRSLISSPEIGRKSLNDRSFRDCSIIVGTNLEKDVINMIGTQRFAKERNLKLQTFYSDDSSDVDDAALERTLNTHNFGHIPDEIQEYLWNQPTGFTDKLVPGKLILCHGLPVMIRNNYATELCITKGQEGYVVGWQEKLGSRGQRILDALFVLLKDPPKTVQIEGLAANVVPLYATTTTLRANLPTGAYCSLKRKQIEVLPNFAMTDYASQGKTRAPNVVHLMNLKSHQAYYTALSRGTSADRTLIVQGFDKEKIQGKCSGALRQ